MYKLWNKVKGFSQATNISQQQPTMATSMTHLFVTVLLVAAHTAFAETTMLQDLCVADLKGIISLFIFWRRRKCKYMPHFWLMNRITIQQDMIQKSSIFLVHFFFHVVIRSESQRVPLQRPITSNTRGLLLHRLSPSCIHQQLLHGLICYRSQRWENPWPQHHGCLHL